MMWFCWSAAQPELLHECQFFFFFRFIFTKEAKVIFNILSVYK